MTVNTIYNNIQILCLCYMSFPETHFDQIEHKLDIDPPQSLHRVSQFYYFRAGMEPVSGTAETSRDFGNYTLIRSSIDFQLPCPQRSILSQALYPRIKILGDGAELLAVYAEGVIAPDQSNIRGEKITYWHLFSKGKLKFEPSTKRRPHDIFGVFTTNIAPFVNDNNYPTFGTRIYNFYAENKMNSAQIEVIASVTKDRGKETFSVTYIPGSRENKPVPITTLIYDQGSWKLTIPNS